MPGNVEKLISIRKRLEFTQHEMATQLGMSLRAYHSLETGESAVRDIHILAAERVALINAVLKENPMLAGPDVRSDALDLAALIREGRLEARG